MRIMRIMRITRDRLLQMLALPMLAASGILVCSSCQKARSLGPPKAVPVEIDGSIRLRTMSFNIRYENGGDHSQRAWSARIPAIVRAIREEQLDLIGIQEALHGQAADLWASLPDYEFFGVARDDGSRRGEYTAILYKRDRFAITPSDSGTFWLSATPNQAGSKTWGNEIPRTVTWARLTDRASNRSFYIFNTHWDHRNQNSRLKSAELIAKRLKLRQLPNAPVILLGDFNAVPNNPAIRSLVEECKLIDALAEHQPTQKKLPTLHFWRGTAMNQALHVDHIFTSRNSTQIAFATIRNHDQPLLSDHFPVIAEVVFATEPP